MSIVGTQLIYRLQDLVRLLIDYRGGTTPPDSFNLYWSDTEGGSYTLFGSVENVPSKVPSIKDKIQYDFIPSKISGWDNNQKNFVKIAPVTGGSEGAQEGPMEIPTRREMIQYSEKSIMYGFNKDKQEFMPITVDQNGKIITA